MDTCRIRWIDLSKNKFDKASDEEKTMIENHLNRIPDDKILIDGIVLAYCNMNRHTFTPILRFMRFVKQLVALSGNNEIEYTEIIHKEFSHSKARIIH